MARSCSKFKYIFFNANMSVCRKNFPTNQQLQTSDFSVVFWGCISRLGVGPLVALEGNINIASYVELLENNL